MKGAKVHDKVYQKWGTNLLSLYSPAHVPASSPES